jgi:hypothetical protein
LIAKKKITTALKSKRNSLKIQMQLGLRRENGAILAIRDL